MDTQTTKSSPTSISLPRKPAWIDKTFHKLMQDGQAHLKSMSNKLHDLGFPFPTKKPAEEAPASLVVDSNPLDFRVKLEKQIQAWRDNNLFSDPNPKIEVTVPKGSLCQLDASVDVGLPPDAVFDIVIDPENRRVFKNIKEVVYRKVLEDEGDRQLVEVEQAAIWKFLWWSGTVAVRVFVEQDRQNHTMKFRLAREGFMKKFEGCWKVEPLFVDEEFCAPFKPSTVEEYGSCSSEKGRVGSRIQLRQFIQPAFIPPPPISWYVRGITAKTTEMLVEDLQAEVKRIRQGFPPSLQCNEGCSQQNLNETEEYVVPNKSDDGEK